MNPFLASRRACALSWCALVGALWCFPWSHVAAAPLSITTNAPEQPCPAPSAAVAAELTRKVHAELVRMRARTASSPPLQVTPICQEKSGYLVSVAWTASSSRSWTENLLDFAGTRSTVWMVPSKGRAVWLDAVLRGPTYDFDGDGVSEASTILGGTLLTIWFDRGQRSTYAVLPWEGTPTPVHWAAWGKLRVWLQPDGSELRAYGFRPGERYEIPEAACAVVSPPAVCARSPAPLSPHVEPTHALPRSPALCVRLPEAERRGLEARLVQLTLANGVHLGAMPAALSIGWGCTSRGVTPVVVRIDEMDDSTSFRYGSVRGQLIELRDGASSGPPDEWTASQRIEIGTHGDFDGDGVAESVVIRSWHGGGRGFAHRTVELAGKEVKLFSDTVVRSPDGTRDAIVELSKKQASELARASKGCVENPGDDHDVDPCIDRSPKGWLPDETPTYDWETTPPQVRVWNGSRLVALPPREVAKVVAATATERAKLRAR